MKSVIETFGTNGNGFASTLTAADLDWTVESEPVTSAGGRVMQRKKMLVRSDTGAPLGIVGSDYAPSDPAHFLKLQYEVAEAIGGRVSRVGFMPDRSRAFAFIDLGEMKLRTDLKVGDPVRSYVYATDGWDGGTARQARLYVERLTCANGQVSRRLSSKLWVSHTKEMDGRYDDRIKPFLSEVRSTVDEVTGSFQKMIDAKMTDAQMERFLLQLLPGDSKITVNRRAAIGTLFAGGVGNLGRTRYDAFNAVTEYVTHHRKYRESDAASVATNRFLGVMETDTLTDEATMILTA